MPSWSLTRPTARAIAHVLDEQRAFAPSYPEVGHSLDRSPRGYDVDHNRQLLGRGEQVFVTACAQLRAWKMFPAWTAVEPAGVPIERDQLLAVVIYALGVWWINPARIVYVVDEPDRLAFAYGTLPGHVECGEERFSIERLDDDTVWYDLRAFSKPRFWGTRVAYPITRALQKRFARDSKAAMVRAMR